MTSGINVIEGCSAIAYPTVHLDQQISRLVDLVYSSRFYELTSTAQAFLIQQLDALVIYKDAFTVVICN